MEGFYLGSFYVHFSWIAILSGYLLAYIVLAFLNAEASMKKWFDESINAILLCFFTYKFSIIFFRPSLLLNHPISILFLTGGTSGFQIGLLIALCYLIWRGRKLRDKLFIKNQIIGLIIMVLGYLLVLTLLNTLSQ
ncbi:hypothetical protein [Peribacillus acanthi]|uniref:hypothetical protein n=1 Tax=Peribacillus acanthi TaxID=2171554 RepID=UPI000D3EB919|nr:hypothetical protein [Peribacillus acanthi]